MGPVKENRIFLHDYLKIALLIIGLNFGIFQLFKLLSKIIDRKNS